MRNISLNQFFVLFILGILLFSDITKTLKNLRNLIKHSQFFKNSKKQQQTQEKRDSNP